MPEIQEYSTLNPILEAAFIVCSVDSDTDGEYETRKFSVSSFRSRLLSSPVPDGASAVGFAHDTDSALSTDGAKLASWSNNGVEKAYIDKDGYFAHAGVYGGLYFSTPASTTLAAATEAKAAGTTTSLGVSNFTHSNNRLQYNGNKTRRFKVTATLSLVKASGTSSAVSVYLAVDGSLVTGLQVDMTVPDTAEYPVSLTGIVQMAESSYVEVFLETDTGDDLTVNTGTVVVEALN